MLSARVRSIGQTNELGTTLQQLGAIVRARCEVIPLLYAALLHSAKSEANAAHNMSDAICGTIRTLLQGHIPTQVTTEQLVADGDLSGYRVLILPECDKLLPETTDALDAFLQQEGGVVAVGRIATNEAEPSQDTLAKVLGIEYVALAGEEHRGDAPSISGAAYTPS